MIDTSSKLCYLCGTRIADTKDHLFPEGLFPKPLPSNLPPRLPACKQCNQGLSKDEEIFRYFVASGMAIEHESGFRIWTERIRPDLKGNRPGLKSFLQSITRLAPIFSETGQLIRTDVISEIQRETIQRVLNKIAKGLYYLDTGEVLPPNVEILSDYFANHDKLVSPPLDEAIKGAKKYDYGDGVITYWRNTIPSDPMTSMIWLWVYRDKAFLICTFRNEVVEMPNLIG